MIVSFLTKLLDTLRPDPYRLEDLDAYIKSKNPQTAHDVEYYTKKFDEEQQRKSSW